MSNLLLLVISVMVTYACQPKHSLEDIIKHQEELLRISNWQDMDIFKDFCPLEGERKNEIDQMASKLQSREMRIPILRMKQDLMFQVLQYDQLHRELLCQAVILDVSGRAGQSGPKPSGSCQSQKQSNVYHVNFDLDRGAAVKMFMGQGGSQQPPTKPPFQKKKIPGKNLIILV